ncbi:MAG: PHP domain-containing protein [Planctomycetaceae bacterium]|jgi:hypothetical protein
MRRLGICGAVVALLAAVMWTAPKSAAPGGSRRVLAAESGLKFFRGNLHTHTLWSDGDDYPEMVAQWYRDQGYDFLSYTDHNTLQVGDKWIDVQKSAGGEEAYQKLKTAFPSDWIKERKSPEGRLEVRLKTFAQVSTEIARPGKFLLIPGEEISDRYGGLPLHMNATNLKEVLPPLGGDSVYEVLQRNTDALVAQRERTGQPMLIHLNHPNFGYAVRAEDLMRVRGENFFEVYNGHPGVHNRGNREHSGTERLWDVILAKRLSELRLPVMYGLATDDGHNYHNREGKTSKPGRGWVMVLARELTPAALIASLEQGQFYSSSGVSLKSVVSSAEGLEVEVAPQAGCTYSIQFIGTRRGFPPEGKPVLDEAGKEVWATAEYSEKIGEVFQVVEGVRANYKFGPDDLYVRAVVTSSKLHPDPSARGEFERAWCQPVRGPAAVTPE